VERLLGRAGDALRAQGFALAVLLAATCLVAILTIDGADARGGHP
jgi:Tfp pilus assembly protein PilX